MEENSAMSSKKKKILYMQTSGVDTPERTYAPFILAATASAMGLDATIYFVIKGVTVVKKAKLRRSSWDRFQRLGKLWIKPSRQASNSLCANKAVCCLA